ncbi:hypothetical protein LshimejAT787_0303380 [Lyophyllum shimeji]|uniref:Uncharacterized protein n=1 Tax=Lyophyllum shimeji TaxID=47721 RepID=A0A9P3PHI4_LYOSH|nr:hypothetical protein LshimejAT787_0303380 [Lyophyllum shimeji]
MRSLFVLLLTAILTHNVFAIPMSTALLYVRRNDNATILDLIAQYKQYKLQAKQAGELEVKLLEEAKAKQLAIEKKIGFSSNSSSWKSTSSSAVEPFTVLTATGSAVVFAHDGATSTVTLNLTTTNPPARASTSTTSPSAGPYTVLTGTGSVIVFAAQETTRTVTLNSTSTTSPAPTNPPTSTTEPVSVLTATGSVVVVASIKTVTLNAMSTGASASATSRTGTPTKT